MNKLFRLLHACALGMASLMISCDEKDGQAIEKFLDVNIKFSPAIKPEAGQLLVARLFYSGVSGVAVAELTPDQEITVTLTEAQITDGFRITFEDVDETRPTAYVFSYVDKNESGDLDEGDLAAFYENVKPEEVEDGNATPTNVAGAYAIDLTHNALYRYEPPVEKEITDADGNVYTAVTIGNQVWLKENLRTTRFANGDLISTEYSDEDWIDLMDRDDGSGVPAYSQHPDGDPATDGLLYNWFAVADVRNICPEGWHVPTDADWQQLEEYLGTPSEELAKDGWRGADMKVGEALKSSAREFGGTDVYLFAALPSGRRDKNTGTYMSYDADAYFWTSDVAPNVLQGVRRVLRNAYISINRGVISKVSGESCRCVKTE